MYFTVGALPARWAASDKSGGKRITLGRARSNVPSIRNNVCERRHLSLTDQRTMRENKIATGAAKHDRYLSQIVTPHPEVDGQSSIRSLHTVSEHPQRRICIPSTSPTPQGGIIHSSVPQKPHGKMQSYLDRTLCQVGTRWVMRSGWTSTQAGY